MAGYNSRCVNTRRLFNILALLCALLFAWTIYAWMRSYQPRHMVVEAAEGRIFLIFWERGGRPITEGLEPGGAFGWRAHLLWRDLMASGEAGDWEWLGFGVAEGRHRMMDCRVFSVPCWFVALVSSMVPVAWVFYTVRQRRRAREHRCLNCGYDLRASGERCPECGTAIAAPDATAHDVKQGLA